MTSRRMGDLRSTPYGIADGHVEQASPSEALLVLTAGSRLRNTLIGITGGKARARLCMGTGRQTGRAAA